MGFANTLEKIYLKNEINFYINLVKQISYIKINFFKKT